MSDLGASGNVVPIGSAVQSSGRIQVFNATTPGSATTTVGPGNLGGMGSPPPTGGHDVDIGKLQTHIRWIERGLAGLAAAAGIAFLFLLGRIDEVNKNVGTVQVAMAAQNATLQDIKDNLGRLSDRIDGELDGQSKTRPRPR